MWNSFFLQESTRSPNCLEAPGRLLDLQMPCCRMNPRYVVSCTSFAQFSAFQLSKTKSQQEQYCRQPVLHHYLLGRPWISRKAPRTLHDTTMLNQFSHLISRSFRKAAVLNFRKPELFPIFVADVFLACEKALEDYRNEFLQRATVLNNYCGCISYMRKVSGRLPE